MSCKSNQIEKLFKHAEELKHFSGVGLVTRGEDVLFHQAFGYAHRGFEVPNQLDTKFDTASITKVFTAAAILQLVDKQLLTLDDKVLDIVELGECSISKEVTVYHLLTHTSGIADDADEEAGESYEALFKEKPNYSVIELTDFLPQFIYKEPNFKPGEGCRYNNCAYILLGLIIEKITGERYRDYIKESIFDVAGMHQTGFYAMDQSVANAAEHYEVILDDVEKVTGYRKNIYSYPSIGSADAGALTTVMDLARFMRSLRAGTLLSEKMTEEMLSPKEMYQKHTEVTETMGYGFQFLSENDTDDIIYLQKDGVNTGVSSIMNYYPKQDMMMIILANQDCDVWDLAWDVQELMLGEPI